MEKINRIRRTILETSPREDRSSKRPERNSMTRAPPHLLGCVVPRRCAAHTRKWRGRRDLDPRPPDFQSGVLKQAERPPPKYNRSKKEVGGTRGAAFNSSL